MKKLEDEIAFEADYGKRKNANTDRLAGKFAYINEGGRMLRVPLAIIFRHLTARGLSEE